ncbi:MAG: hypothetical protein KAW09_10425, partial [Thermoplasmata archaeon]|nr:hypothetical protein [Thermoplasmata archaeon]
KPTKPAVQRKMAVRGTDILAVVLRKPDVVEDILYPQIWKAQKSIGGLCEKYEFTVMDCGSQVVGNEILILMELASAVLPPVRKHMGPATWMKNADDFIEKWKGSGKRIAGPYVEDGRLFFDLKREYKDAKSLLRKEIKTVGLGKNLDEVVSRRFRILVNDEILSGGYIVPLAGFLEKSVKPTRR